MTRFRISRDDVIAALAALGFLGGIRLLCWIGCKLMGVI